MPWQPYTGGRPGALQRDTMGKVNRAIVAALVRQRKVAGITQTDIARALGGDQPYVSKLERGERRLDVVDYLRYCRAIGADPGELLRAVRLR
jgi:transcriptional regulator with XRE-family HTH domain